MRWLAVLRAFFYFFLSGGIGLYLIWLACGLGVIVGLEAAAVPILSLIPAVFTAVAIHELGHVLGGLWAGFRIRQVSVCGLLLDIESSTFGFHPNKGGTDMLGYVAFGPCPAERLKRRLAVFTAAGPFANVFGVALCLWLACLLQPSLRTAGHVSLREMWAHPWLFPQNGWVVLCDVAAVVGLFFAINSLIPDNSRAGPNDGLTLLGCCLARPVIFRDLAVATLHVELARGVRPRDWDAGWIGWLAEHEDGSAEQTSADLFRYFHAEDCGRVEEAGRLIDRSLAACQGRVPLPSDIYLEAAYFAGFHRRDAEAAARLLGQIDRESIEDHTWLRAEAAVRGAQGKHAEALALIESALEAVPRSLDPGGAIAERDWLERMRSHYLDRMAPVGQDGA